MEQVILETDRLILRPFTMEDAPGVLEFSSNPEAQKHTGDVMRTTIEEVENVITNVWFSDYTKYGYGRFAVVHKADNKIIGFNGIKYLSDIDETDLGYRFLPEYWGKGIATESSKAIVDYAFKNHKLDKLIGFVMLENPASSAVLKKLGFEFSKLAPYPGEEEDGNLEWYSLTRSAYEKR